MQIETELIALAATVIPAVVWLVRLEGRVNAADKEGAAIRLELVALQAKAEADSKANRQTADGLIRVEERLKYLTELMERHYSEPEKLPRRRTPP